MVLPSNPCSATDGKWFIAVNLAGVTETLRTLKQRVYANERLTKIGIKNDSFCNMCPVEKDSNLHMTSERFKSKFLRYVPNWIKHLGIID